MNGFSPPLRPFGGTRVLAPTGPESADFDARAIQALGVPQPVLMENAGRSAAQLLTALHPSGPVVVLVGAGNNGGDALVAARSLAAWGREVTAVLVADREPDALLHGWDVPTVDDATLADDPVRWEAVLGPASVIVDGILGTGVRGAPRERQARAIRHLRRCGRPVLALDIPSGVDATTGAVPGDAVRADVTVAFGAPKLGTLLHPGRGWTGRLVAVEIGFPPMRAGDAAVEVVTPAWARERFPARASDTHKNAVGRLVVVAGRSGMGGAAVLAVRAAFRAGAGLVQVCSPAANRPVLQAAVPEAIFVDPGDASALEEALDAADAVAAGPGLGTDAEAEAVLDRVLARGRAPLVLDADALNLLARGRPTRLPGALEGRPALLTPHPGEMSRLRGTTAENLAADRVRAVRDAAADFGCAVLLKGAPSLVAMPGAPLRVDTQGSSDLAVAGMGDVLTGVAGGLLAQGVEPAAAGAVALYLTGRAAVLAGRGPGLVPGDVVRRLPDALVERAEPGTTLPMPWVVFDQDPAR